MVTCELCGKQVKTAQALRGHKNFIHGTTSSSTQQPVAPLASEQQVSLLEDRLQQLEYFTGLRESDWDDLLSDTEPLTYRLTNITEQLSKLSNAVSKLSEAVEATAATKAMVEAEREEFSKRLTDLRESYNRQATVVNDHRDTFNKNLTVLGSRIDKVQKTAEGVVEDLSTVRTNLATHGHDGLSLISQLSNRLEKMGEQIAGLQAGVARAQALAVRKPTDDFERLELANGSKHTFRVYRGKRGLCNPHRVSVDPFLGDEYVDLAEPED